VGTELKTKHALHKAAATFPSSAFSIQPDTNCSVLLLLVISNTYSQYIASIADRNFSQIARSILGARINPPQIFRPNELILEIYAVCARDQLSHWLPVKPAFRVLVGAPWALLLLAVLLLALMGAAAGVPSASNTSYGE